MEYKEFIEIWQTSKDYKEIMERTGMSKDSVASKAQHLRSIGVPLKKFRRQPISKQQVEELADFAKSFTKV